MTRELRHMLARASALGLFKVSLESGETITIECSAGPTRTR